MPPPQLPRNTPIPNAGMPLLISLGVARREKGKRGLLCFRFLLCTGVTQGTSTQATQHRGIHTRIQSLIRTLGQPLIRHPHIPLITQVRLNHRLAPVTELDAVAIRLHRLHQSAALKLLHHRLAPVRHLHAHKHARLTHIAPAVLVTDAAVGRHHVHRVKLVPSPDLRIVLVVRRRHLQKPRRKLRLGVVLFLLARRHRFRQHHIRILDDRNNAAHQRQHHLQAHQRLRTRVFRAHRHRRVTQIRLRPRRRNRHVLDHRAIRECGRRSQRVSQIIKRRIHLFVITLIIRHRRLQRRVPVHQPLAAINQPILEQDKERFAHRLGAHLIHREALPLPIARATHRLQLPGDHRLIFILERLNLRDKVLARKLAPTHLLIFHHALLNHRLRGDARVVRPRHPQRLKPPHPVRPRQNVLQRTVERVPQVQPIGHIRWRHHDRIGLRVAPQHPGRVRVKGP